MKSFCELDGVITQHFSNAVLPVFPLAREKNKMKRVTYDAVHSAGKKIGNRHQNYDVIASAHIAMQRYHTRRRERGKN